MENIKLSKKYLGKNLQIQSVIASETEEEISRIVLHELLHTVINEMRNWEKEDGGDHEERVVSHLTMIIDRLGPLTKIKK